MNGGSEAIVDTVITATGAIPFLLIHSVNPAIRPSGFSVMTSPITVLHGNGPMYMVQITTTFNGASQEDHGMISREVLFMAPG